VAAVLLVLALGVACSTAALPLAPVPSLVEAKRQVADYVASGRYEADIVTVVAKVRASLSRHPPGTARVAIVLDVDETALSNLPWLRANDYGWIVSGPCEPIKPVLELASSPARVAWPSSSPPAGRSVSGPRRRPT
jgi:hypothetical protein